VRDFFNDTFSNQELWQIPDSISSPPIFQCGKKWIGGRLGASEYFNREIDTTGINFASSEMSVEFLFFGKWIQDDIAVYLNGKLFDSISSDTQVDHKCQYCDDKYEQSIMKMKLRANLKHETINTISFRSSMPIYFREFTVSYAFCPPDVSYFDSQSSDIHRCKCQDGYFRDLSTSHFKCLKCPVFCKTCTSPSRSECIDCAGDFHKSEGACVSEKCKLILIYF
jgi:hypothetical protein